MCNDHISRGSYSFFVILLFAATYYQFLSYNSI